MINDTIRTGETVIPVLRRAEPSKVIGGQVKTIGRVTAVLTNVYTGKVRVHETTNLVTIVGDIHYAQAAVGETPTNDFQNGLMELYNGASAAPAQGNDRSNMTGLVSGSAKAFDTNYPKTNDGDADNTGAGTDVATFLVSYATGEANASNIDDVIITNSAPGASEPLLMHAEFAAPFTKTSSDTLKVFVNHTFEGAGA